MASVVLPTTEWTPSCRQLYDQLEEDDELLVVCDAEDDPVAEISDWADDDPRVELVVAGDPVGCSGKANALAAGLERATQHRIVCTDDDLDRGDDWLATVKRLGEEYGAASAVPVFVSDEFPFVVLEPLFAVFGSGGLLAENMPWGGGVTFDRRDVDEEAYLVDLRRTVSDDELLAQYLDDLTATRELVHEVRVEGGWRGTYHRVVRFFRTVYLLEPTGLVPPLVASLLVLALAVVSLPVAFVAVPLATFAAYRYVGIDRWTWVLALPAFLLIPALTALGVRRDEFEWGGRRYRWRSRFEVDVLD